MKMLKGLVAVLMLLGISSQALAWSINVHNKTPFGIMVKAKSWKGLLHGDWVTIPAGQVAKAGLRGADCIDGMWVKIDMPGKGYTEIGYYSFAFAPMSPCSNTTAVVGVEPVITEEVVGAGPSTSGRPGTMQNTMGTISAIRYVLKQLKFYVAHVHGNVDSAPAATNYVLSK